MIYLYSPLGLKVATPEHKNGSIGIGVNKPDNWYKGDKDLQYQYHGKSRPSRKNFQGKNLHRRRSVETRSVIVNTPSECLPPVLTNSIQSLNTISSTYMDNNDLYQGLIQKKKLIIPIISSLRPSKYHHTVIEQQHDPSPNVMKASDILLIPGDDDMVQYISPHQ